jgi:Ricin-type beta-trefoil lectin domain-like
MASRWRKRTATVVMAVVAMAGASVGTASARIYGPFEIVNAHTHLCLVVPGGNRASGTRLIQWGCNAAYNDQQWVEDNCQATMDGVAITRLRNVYTRQCLDVPGNTSTRGVQLIQSPCGAFPEHTDDFWGVYPPAEDGLRWIRSFGNSIQCVAVPGASLAWGRKSASGPAHEPHQTTTGTSDPSPPRSRELHTNDPGSQNGHRHGCAPRHCLRSRAVPTDVRLFWRQVTWSTGRLTAAWTATGPAGCTRCRATTVTTKSGTRPPTFS